MRPPSRLARRRSTRPRRSSSGAGGLHGRGRHHSLHEHARRQVPRAQILVTGVLGPSPTPTGRTSSSTSATPRRSAPRRAHRRGDTASSCIPEPGRTGVARVRGCLSPGRAAASVTFLEAASSGSRSLTTRRKAFPDSTPAVVPRGALDTRVPLSCRIDCATTRVQRQARCPRVSRWVVRLRLPRTPGLSVDRSLSETRAEEHIRVDRNPGSCVKERHVCSRPTQRETRGQPRLLRHPLRRQGFLSGGAHRGGDTAASMGRDR
jgi:hypothetical protein